MLLTLAAFAVVLGVLIFVHEAGHFMAAKAVGIQVLRFSLGFGRPVVSFRRGETEYWISWIPFGGYVKMAGVEDEGPAGALEGGKSPVPVDPARAFDRKPLWARFVVVLAGVTMNAVFAFAVYSGLAFAGALGPESIATTQVDSVVVSELPPRAGALAALRRGDRITAVNGDSVRTWGDLRLKLVNTPGPLRVSVAGRADPIVLDVPETDTTTRYGMVLALSPALPPVIARVQAGSAGEQAGFKPGDRILTVDGVTVQSWQDFARTARSSPGRELAVEVLRGAGRVSLRVVPQRREEKDSVTKEVRSFGFVGVGPLLVPRPGALGATRIGWQETRDRAALILGFLAKFVTGKASPRELGGPLLIGQISGQAARVGLGTFLGFMAFLSVNLAILNLLPIPILDGGQAAFLLAEAVRRKPLPLELRLRLTQIGFVVLLGIMILATSNDILRWRACVQPLGGRSRGTSRAGSRRTGSSLLSQPHTTGKREKGNGKRETGKGKRHRGNGKRCVRSSRSWSARRPASSSWRAGPTVRGSRSGSWSARFRSSMRPSCGARRKQCWGRGTPGRIRGRGSLRPMRDGCRASCGRSCACSTHPLERRIVGLYKRTSSP